MILTEAGVHQQSPTEYERGKFGSESGCWRPYAVFITVMPTALARHR